MQKIVVLGAGYSGQLAAKLAAKTLDASVTLINARDEFVERVRLHQLASGQQLRTRKLSELLGSSNVDVVVGTVTAIDAKRKTVRLSDDRIVSYDVLIYALGSMADMQTVPGVAEHAYSVAGVEQARLLRERLRDGGSVAVVGGGLTGIESATELAETLPELALTLVTAEPLGAALSERGRDYLRRACVRLGIDVIDNAEVKEVRSDGLLLASGDQVTVDTVVWTTGFTVPALAREAGFAVDVHGRMVVDETLRSVSHPDVYAIGDAAAGRTPGGQELRMACATGLPAAQQAVHALRDRAAGRTPRPFKFRYYQQCISLGRRDALIQFVRQDDSPVERVLTGRFAALYKETIVRGATQVLRFPRIPTSL